MKKYLKPKLDKQFYKELRKNNCWIVYNSKKAVVVYPYYTRF